MKSKTCHFKLKSKEIKVQVLLPSVLLCSVSDRDVLPRCWGTNGVLLAAGIWWSLIGLLISKIEIIQNWVSHWMDAILRVPKLAGHIYYSSREGHWRYSYLFFKVALSQIGFPGKQTLKQSLICRMSLLSSQGINTYRWEEKETAIGRGRRRAVA